MKALRHVLFDMNGTLLDPAAMAEPLGGREEDVELVNGALEATVLSAMTDTLTGVHHGFGDLLAASIGRALARVGRSQLASSVIDAAGDMKPFPEAAEALALRLRAGWAARRAGDAGRRPLVGHRRRSPRRTRDRMGLPLRARMAGSRSGAPPRGSRHGPPGAGPRSCRLSGRRRRSADRGGAGPPASL